MCETRNCHEYCRYGKQCRYNKGDVGRRPDDCGTFYTIEKVVAEVSEGVVEDGDDDD